MSPLAKSMCDKEAAAAAAIVASSWSLELLIYGSYGVGKIIYRTPASRGRKATFGKET